MKILVLASQYPRPDGFVGSFFIHNRNKSFVEQGIDVSVICFKAQSDYIIDGVKVYTIDTYEKKFQQLKFDMLVSHAPNLRNHYKFLKKHERKFKNIVYFFHGHEVLISSMIYPEPYIYIKKTPILSRLAREIYDRFKLIIWKRYFTRTYKKSQFVFVSNWMKEMFEKFTTIEPSVLKDRSHIIYNCIGGKFETSKYDVGLPKEHDFITIRNLLDKSKYSIDIVCRIAENNPQYKFCLVGKGEFFEFNKKPDNLEWVEKHLTHEEVIGYLNKSRCALMPTRADAQGVMACEIATFGIPLITSNIDVCKEIFGGFENVAFIDNNDDDIDIGPILKNLQGIEIKDKNERYFVKNTVGKEIELFKRLKG